MVISTTVSGTADAQLTPADIDSLAGVGMYIEPGSTHGNMYYARDATQSYRDSATNAAYDVSMTHTYEAIINQDLQTITH